MDKHVDVVVIGAGQAGLAMGYFLAKQGRPFVILDGASRIGDSWRRRYDSLKLFTPAAYNNLPGLPFPAAADHYPTKDEVADYLERYAATFDLPVVLGSKVLAVKRVGAGYRVQTEGQAYQADQVVIAAGPFHRPFTPAISQGLAAGVFQLHSSGYKNPDPKLAASRALGARHCGQHRNRAGGNRSRHSNGHPLAGPRRPVPRPRHRDSRRSHLLPCEGARGTTVDPPSRCKARKLRERT